MTLDLEPQVRAYAEFLASTLPVVDADDVISGRLAERDVTSVEPSRRLVPRWAVVVAAAIAALLLVGGLAVWLRAFIEDPPPFVEEPEQTTATTTALDEPQRVEVPTTTLTGLPGQEEAPSGGAADPPTPGIAFVSQTGNDRRIYLMGVEGEVTNLSGFSHDAFGPVWSPGGTHIAYQSSTGLYVMATSVVDVVQLTDRQTSGPAWSPFGSQIAYLADGLYVVAVDGSNETMVTGTGGTSEGSVDWSPDGTRIVYASVADDGSSSIFAVNADGSGQRQLAEGRGPVWSPDGSLIAYEARSSAGDWDINVMGADGSNPQPLAAEPGGDDFGAVGRRMALASRTPPWSRVMTS